MADGLLRSVYHGCIAGGDVEIDRRPYHKNCGCALCDRRNRHCSHAMPKHKTVSYPMRRAWSEGSMVMAMAASSVSSPSSPPVTEVAGRPHQLGLNDEEEENIIWSIRR